MVTNDFSDRSSEIWSAMALGWEAKRGAFWSATHSVGEWLVARLDPQPGQIILDLAAGPGATGFLAAAKLGDKGKLISTDFASGMVEVAKRVSAELKLTNVDHRVMDAERMEIADDSVDGVLCRWGYMLMGDPLAAFKETRRVLRSGGKLCFACFTGPQQNPWAAIPGKVLIERGHMAPPPPESPGIFALSDKSRITSLLEKAGFQHPQFEDIPFHWHFENFDDHWFFLMEMAGALSPILAALDEGERGKARADIESSLIPFQTTPGIDIPSVSLNAVTE